MGKTLDYIVTDKKSGRLSYRRRFPADLQPFIPTDGPGKAWELRVTLRDTRTSAAALQRYRAAELKYDAIERQAREAKAGSRKPLDEATIRFLADTFLAAEIDHTNRRRGALPGSDVEELRPYPVRNDPEADWEESRTLLSDDDYDLQGIVDMWGEWAVALARAYGIVVQPQGQAYVDLCVALADAACRLWLVIDPHQSRRPISTAPKAALLPHAAPVAPSPPAPAIGAEKTVSDLLDAYEKKRGEKWSNSSKMSYAPVRRLIEGALGSRLVASIGRDDANRMRGLVQRLPKNLGKQKVLSGLSVLDAIERGTELGLPIIEPKTMNDGYIIHIAATFAYACSEQWIARSPFYDLEVPDDVEDNERRDPFKLEQLSAIFATRTWASVEHGSEAKPARYWLPLLGLFQGARVAELAGLRVSDVEQIEGATWVLRIRPHALRRLKNKSCRRDIPIHPSVMEFGFASFAEARKKEVNDEPDAPLFPDVASKQRGQVGYNVSNWFSGLVKELQLEGRKLGFHSFRHNFEDALRRARLDETAVGNYLSGRSARLPSSGKIYGGGYKEMVPELLSDLVKVTYPALDLSAVRPWKAPGAS